MTTKKKLRNHLWMIYWACLVVVIMFNLERFLEHPIAVLAVAAIVATVWLSAVEKTVALYPDEPPLPAGIPPGMPNAAFATSAQNEAAGLLGFPTGFGIPLGYQRVKGQKGDAIRYRGSGHVAIIGPPRTGKFTDFIAPILLETGLGSPPYPWHNYGVNPAKASTIVIDPKGQAAAVTMWQRARLGHKVILLNPFHVWPRHLGPENPAFTDWPSILGPPKDFVPNIIFDGCFNPMPAADDERFAEECTACADGCVVRSDKARDPFWYDSARQLIAGIVGEVAETFRPDKRNMAEVAKIIAGGPESVWEFAASALRREGSPWIRDKLGRYVHANDMEIRSELEVISTAITQMDFITSSPHIASNLSGESSFHWPAIKHEPTTIYLILPLSQMETCKKWFRIIIESACTALMDEANEGPLPVLMLLDEFAQLGHLDIMTTVMNAGAGRGLRAMPILQNLPDLKQIYGDKYESFLAGAAIQVFLGARDNFTADYIQRKSGIRTIETIAENSSRSIGVEGQVSTSTSTSSHLHQLPLVHAYQAAQMADNGFVMFDERGLATLGYREAYFRSLEYGGAIVGLDPNEQSASSASLH